MPVETIEIPRDAGTKGSKFLQINPGRLALIFRIQATEGALERFAERSCGNLARIDVQFHHRRTAGYFAGSTSDHHGFAEILLVLHPIQINSQARKLRSEERRVGKE